MQSAVSRRAHGRLVRLGVIGTGYAASRLHLPALHRQRDRFEIVAFSDTSHESAVRFAELSGVPIDCSFPNYHDLLRRDDVEAVVIALPVALLYSAAQDALGAGKHVLCEKPPGADLHQGRAFLNLQNRFPQRVFLVAENYFYRDDLRLARMLIDRGAIGRLVQASWRLSFHTGARRGLGGWRQLSASRGGSHLEHGIHHAAQIRMLCGDVIRLSGEYEEADPHAPGASHVAMSLRFAGGGIGSYACVHSALPIPAGSNEMQLFGSEGTMSVGRGRVSLYRSDCSVDDYGFEGLDRGFFNEYTNFYEAVVLGAPVVGTVAQSYANMLVIVSGLDAADGGRMIDLSGEVAASPVPLWVSYGHRELLDGSIPQVSVVRRGPNSGSGASPWIPGVG